MNNMFADRMANAHKSFIREILKVTAEIEEGIKRLAKVIKELLAENK